MITLDENGKIVLIAERKELSIEEVISKYGMPSDCRACHELCTLCPEHEHLAEPDRERYED